MTTVYRFALWLALALPSLPAARPAEEPAPEAAGRRDYQVHCLNCHGEQGRGDGPLAAILTVRPADLRTLARRNGGAFPLELSYRIIDGREEIAGHGLRDMPVWGLSFAERGSDAPQAEEVRARIHELIEYLRSLQVGAGAPEAAKD